MENSLRAEFHGTDKRYQKSTFWYFLGTFRYFSVPKSTYFGTWNISVRWKFLITQITNVINKSYLRVVKPFNGIVNRETISYKTAI